jgi:tetratricopeptide (TPR) repeat protein
MDSAAASNWEAYHSQARDAFLRGDLTEAERLYHAALREVEGLGADDPRVVASFEDLLQLYGDQGFDLTKLDEMGRQWLSLQEASLGLLHPSLVPTLQILGRTAERLGHSAEAERVYQRALSIQERAFGPDQLDLIISLYHLAHFYQNERYFARAEPLWRRALALCERAAIQSAVPQGRRQWAGTFYLPDVLTNLAEVYQAQGMYAEEEALRRRLLTDAEARAAGAPIIIVFALQRLAAACRAQGKYIEAEALLQRAFAIRDRAVAAASEAIPEDTQGQVEVVEDSALAMLLQEYATVLRGLHREAEAEALYLRALAHLDVHGPSAGSRLDVLRAYANLLHDLGREAEALPLFRRALSEMDVAPRDSLLTQEAILRDYAAVLRKMQLEVEASEIDARLAAVRPRVAAYQRRMQARFLDDSDGSEMNRA